MGQGPPTVRLAPENFTAQGSVWCYLMEDSFIQCRGVVIGTCPKTHDPENGRNIRICRLPVEARPRRGLQFAALSREAYDVGGHVTYTSSRVTLTVTPDGWICGHSTREMQGAIDLSAVRFCKTGGLSLTDEVTLHTVDVGGSRLVCLQGHLHECFFASDSKRPVAMLPESCRPQEVLSFVTAGSGPGAFHLVQLRPIRGSGIGGDLMWKDGVWSHDQVHLTGIMYEVNPDALQFSFLDASWTPEILRIFVAEFQKFLISKFGGIEEAWDEAFDLTGEGVVNFTQFSMGCKKAGYVGNATRLWAALCEDGGGEIKLEELARDYLNPPAEPQPESEVTRRPSLAAMLSGLEELRGAAGMDDRGEPMDGCARWSGIPALLLNASQPIPSPLLRNECHRCGSDFEHMEVPWHHPTASCLRQASGRQPAVALDASLSLQGINSGSSRYEVVQFIAACEGRRLFWALLMNKVTVGARRLGENRHAMLLCVPRTCDETAAAYWLAPAFIETETFEGAFVHFSQQGRVVGVAQTQSPLWRRSCERPDHVVLAPRMAVKAEEEGEFAKIVLESGERPPWTLWSKELRGAPLVYALLPQPLAPVRRGARGQTGAGGAGAAVLFAGDWRVEERSLASIARHLVHPLKATVLAVLSASPRGSDHEVNRTRGSKAARAVQAKGVLKRFFPALAGVRWVEDLSTEALRSLVAPKALALYETLGGGAVAPLRRSALGGQLHSLRKMQLAWRMVEIWVADHPPLRLFEPPDAVWTVPLAGAQELLRSGWKLEPPARVVVATRGGRQLPQIDLDLDDLWDAGPSDRGSGYEHHPPEHAHEHVHHVHHHHEHNVAHLGHSHDEAMSDLGLALISSGTTVLLATISAVLAMRLFREMLRTDTPEQPNSGGVIQMDIPGLRPFVPFNAPRKGDSTPKGGCWHFTAVGKELSAPGEPWPVASAAASAAGETGEAKLNSISDAVTAGVNGAVDNMANGASSVAQQGSDAVAGVGSAVNSAANGAADAAASGTEKVASAFTSASDAVTGAAAGATAGVSNGVAGVASAAGDVAADPFAILTTGAPVASTTKFEPWTGGEAVEEAGGDPGPVWGSDDLPREDRKSDAKAWWFPVALVVVVALACGVRICAFFLFGSNYTKKEKEKELNKKKISMSAQGWEASETRKKQLQSQSRVPAGSAMPGVYSQQLPPVLMSGSYQVPQAGSPLGYVMPPGGSPMASYGQVPVTGQPQYYVQQ
eukprot:g2759.t1